MAVFGYLRVSTARQAEDGLSIEIQEERIEGYARTQSLAVNVWLRDRGVSGGIPLSERAAGERLLREVQPGDVVITAKLDRMFRSARDALNVLEGLKEKGVSLHCIDLGGSVTNGVGQLVFTILSAVAEQERSRIKERITEAKQKMRDDNRYQGGKVPFGYRVASDRSLIPDELQQKCLENMRLRRAEGMPFRKISEYLLRELGVKLSHHGVRTILLGDRKTK